MWQPWANVGGQPIDTADSDRGRILHLGCPQSHVVRGGAQDALADAGQDGWRGAATASSAALGALFLLLIAVVAALAYSIAGSGNHMLTSGPNDFVGRLRVDFVPAHDAYQGRGA